MKSTYSKSLDTFRISFVLVPCALLSLVLHPKVTGMWFTDVSVPSFIRTPYLSLHAYMQKWLLF